MYMKLNEYRCYITKKLLCKASGKGQVEIMSPAGRILNYTGPSRKSQDIGLKGVAFQANCVDCRCTKCNRLLGRAGGTDLVVEIKCKYCHGISLFDLAKLQKKRLASLGRIQRENLLERIRIDFEK